MKLHWLIALPLAGALVVALLRRWRVPMILATLATLLGCLRLSSMLPMNQAETFLEQQWMLSAGAQRLLIAVYVATGVLLAIAATTRRADTVHAPLLASLGLLSAAVLLRSWLLSFLLLPVALIVPVLATVPSRPSAAHGAAHYLAWTAAPIPFLLAIPWLLDQLAVRPQELAVIAWSAWLVLPAWILWLNLFPFNGATPLWAEGGPPLAPAFVWTIKDAAVIYLLLGLWRQMPALQTESVLSALRTLGLLTALFGGVWAVIQSSVSGVLGCAAMAVLGVTVQGLASGSVDGLSAATFLLLSRSAAVLLATAALTALYDSAAGSPQESRRWFPWARHTPQAGHSPHQDARRTVSVQRRWTMARQEPGVSAESRSSSPTRIPWEGLMLWLISVAGVLALLRLPMMDSPAQGPGALAVLQALPGEPRLWQAWRLSSIGILIGLVQTGWRLWRDRVRNSAGRIRPVPFLLAVCLLLLCLYLARSPQLVASWVSGLMLP